MATMQDTESDGKQQRPAASRSYIKEGGQLRSSTPTLKSEATEPKKYAEPVLLIQEILQPFPVVYPSAS